MIKADLVGMQAQSTSDDYPIIVKCLTLCKVNAYVSQVCRLLVPQQISYAIILCFPILWHCHLCSKYYQSDRGRMASFYVVWIHTHEQTKKFQKQSTVLDLYFCTQLGGINILGSTVVFSSLNTWPDYSSQ